MRCRTAGWPGAAKCSRACSPDRRSGGSWTAAPRNVLPRGRAGTPSAACRRRTPGGRTHRGEAEGAVLHQGEAAVPRSREHLDAPRRHVGGPNLGVTRDRRRELRLEAAAPPAAARAGGIPRTASEAEGACARRRSAGVLPSRPSRPRGRRRPASQERITPTALRRALPGRAPSRWRCRLRRLRPARMSLRRPASPPPRAATGPRVWLVQRA